MVTDCIRIFQCNFINIKYILDLRDFPGLTYSDKFIKDFNIILNDSSVKVVAEVMGGLNPAYEFTKSLLLAGKSVVTSNKELVATYGTELLELACNKNENYLFVVTTRASFTACGVVEIYDKKTGEKQKLFAIKTFLKIILRQERQRGILLRRNRSRCICQHR